MTLWKAKFKSTNPLGACCRGIVAATLSLLCLPPLSSAAVTFRWMGNTGFTLTDGTTTLLFDPAVTSVPLHRWALPFLGIQSDPEELAYWSERCGIQKLDATFVNHTHTDHAIDAPDAVKKFGGFLAGSESLRQIGLGHGLKEESIRVLKDQDILKVGKFSVQAIETPHAPHFSNILLSDGEITAPLLPGSSPWSYRVGTTFSYWVTHPDGNVLFQATGRVRQPDRLQSFKPDTLLLTIANRLSTEDLIDNRIVPSQAKSVIPLHWDNFFLPLKREGKPHPLWFQNLQEFDRKALTSAYPSFVYWAEYCEPIFIRARGT